LEIVDVVMVMVHVLMVIVVEKMDIAALLMLIVLFSKDVN